MAMLLANAPQFLTTDESIARLCIGDQQMNRKSKTGTQAKVEVSRRRSVFLRAGAEAGIAAWTNVIDIQASPSPGPQATPARRQVSKY